MYNEPHLFKVHNSISFDICIHSRNHNHPQDNECTHRPKGLLRPLRNPSHQVSLAAPHPWRLLICSCHYTLVCIFRNFNTNGITWFVQLRGKVGVWLLSYSIVAFRSFYVAAYIHSSFYGVLSSLTLHRHTTTHVVCPPPMLVFFPGFGDDK